VALQPFKGVLQLKHQVLNPHFCDENFLVYASISIGDVSQWYLLYFDCSSSLPWTCLHILCHPSSYITIIVFKLFISLGLDILLEIIVSIIILHLHVSIRLFSTHNLHN
jgi:hypothetical protein